MNLNVLKAIFQRDFVSYFSNPTGYVFICVFVVLSSAATFWPPEFFSNNLANLDQMSRWLPFIMLVFIPAITMSIWSEEKRRGTDELLLTMPVSDVGVVLGKYFSGVAIFTVAVFFSMFAVFLVFSWGLGTPDGGLFVATYIGYWFIGIAMLSVGMIASFLTSNLTVSFILGMLLNLPLALAGVAEWIVTSPELAQSIRRWSMLEQFQNFQRGVISLSGISYFLMIVVVMLYLSVVLIGRRHWSGGKDGRSMLGHFVLRIFSLVAIVVGVNLLVSNHNFIRIDMTSENLNSVAEGTIQQLEAIKNDPEIGTIRITAYMNPQVPAEFVQTKLNLISTLDELESLSGGKVIVTTHLIENFSEQADLARRANRIEPQSVVIMKQGIMVREKVLLGCVVASGLDKIVIPFFNKGVPIEYELVRSIATVSQQKRRRLGIVKTDIQLFSGFTSEGVIPESGIVRELKKQYNVIEVDPSKPITESYDVLFVVQPSSLSPEGMDHLVAAIKTGQPTAIFEDPYVNEQMMLGSSGTDQPRKPASDMSARLLGNQGPRTKGDLNQLWRTLGITMRGSEIIWENFTPEKRLATFRQLLFIDRGNIGAGGAGRFNEEHQITSGMSQVMLWTPGSFYPNKRREAKLNFTPLMTTGNQTGVVYFNDLKKNRESYENITHSTNESYVIAAHVTGKPGLDESFLDQSETNQELAEGEDDVVDLSTLDSKSLNVVLCADIDLMSDAFLRLQEMGDQNFGSGIRWRFQNSTFILNTLDFLAGDERFIALRKRSRSHRILDQIETESEQYREEFEKESEKSKAKIDRKKQELVENVRKVMTTLYERKDLDPVQKRQLMGRTKASLERKANVAATRLNKEQELRKNELKRQLDASVRSIQDRFKKYAVLLPPIPPLLLAFWVFFRRRNSEQEGVNKERLRFTKAKIPTSEEPLG